MQAELIIDLAAGTEEIGLAVMLHDLMTQNIAQHPRKLPDFKKLNIPIGLVVSDVEIELTLEFSGGRLTIHPGIKDQPKLHIATDAATLMSLSNQRIKWGLPYYFDETGKEIISAMKNGRLKVRGMIRHFPSLLRFSRLMSVY